ncbi:MAG TPA: hypothetical protein VFJ84_00995 [Candidatus Saccharimonadales bacterium]|nr:hypothetical protein [Candidatus Saccharimonadales bacterium]
MAVVCPTILADTADDYRRQMEKVAGFAERIQIDLSDGEFAVNKTVGPEDAWWPAGVKADFHLMYKNPSQAIEKLLEHRPHMIIVHAESAGSFTSITHRLKSLHIKVGVALLPPTAPDVIVPALSYIDHVMIFSGSLGHFGGHANLDLLHKIKEIKQHNPNLEIGWDGGINERNISQLAFGGVDVFDVGGYIQQAEDPHKAYLRLARIAQETGTT